MMLIITCQYQQAFFEVVRMIRALESPPVSKAVEAKPRRKRSNCLLF